ncbi:MAG: septum formation initiator family protein [Bacillota bacterium]|nr:septum formation initiator family protein [Bacillota bacterium]
MPRNNDGRGGAQTAKRRKKTPRWLTALTLAAVLFVVVQFTGQYLRYQELRKEADFYRDQLQQAESEYQYLLEQKELYYNDAFIERVARENLGMVKQGETVVSTVSTAQTELLEQQAQAAGQSSSAAENEAADEAAAAP